MKQYLLPVWGDSRSVSSAKDLGWQPTDWYDKEPFNYGHALISPVHWKRAFTFPESCHVFGDSGGFTLRQGGTVKIDPIDVLNWQASMCTVGCILDLPPGFVGKRDWEKGLKVTVGHTQRALPRYQQILRTGSKFRWWGVLHGHNQEEVQEYFDRVSAVYPFTGDGEGWAIRAEPTVSIYSVARSLRILKKLGIKRAHFLAATSQKVIAVLLALAPQAGIEFLTYDSSYAVKGGINRHTFVPSGDATFSVLSEEKDERFGRDYMLRTCPCPVCAYMRERSKVSPKAEVQNYKTGAWGGWWSTWAQLHNLHIQVEMTKAQAEQDADKFLRHILPAKVHSEVLRIFEADGFETLPVSNYRGRSIVGSGSTKSLLDLLK